MSWSAVEEQLPPETQSSWKWWRISEDSLNLLEPCHRGLPIQEVMAAGPLCTRCSHREAPEKSMVAIGIQLRN